MHLNEYIKFKIKCNKIKIELIRIKTASVVYCKIAKFPGIVLLQCENLSMLVGATNRLPVSYLCGILWCILSLGLCDVGRLAGVVVALFDWFWELNGLGWLLGDCWMADRTA